MNTEKYASAIKESFDKFKRESEPTFIKKALSVFTVVLFPILFPLTQTILAVWATAAGLKQLIFHPVKIYKEIYYIMWQHKSVQKFEKNFIDFLVQAGKEAKQESQAHQKQRAPKKPQDYLH